MNNNNIIYGGESHTGSVEYIDFTSLSAALPKMYLDVDSGNIVNDHAAGTPSTSLIVEPPSFIEAYNGSL
jgi:hypothetical protein